MPTPHEPPTPEKLDAWRDHAMVYLRGELRDAAPAELANPVIFPVSPLEGEGPTAIFTFESSRTGEAPQRYAVVVGETEPNYYDVGDLSPDEIFELHLGTRFMLVMGVSQIPQDSALVDADYDLARDAGFIAHRAVAGAMVDSPALAAMFSVEDQRHAVIKAQINGQPVYIMGRDAPLGFSTKVHLAPHVAYRLHIGHVLRREAKPEEN